MFNILVLIPVIAYSNEKLFCYLTEYTANAQLT